MSPMKIALAGTGRMGTAVEALAQQRGHTIVARFNSRCPLPEKSKDLMGADVVIDFSLPSVVTGNMTRYARWQQPAVVGTTGWLDALPSVKAMVAQHGGALLYAPNFSLGVQITLHVLRTAARLAARLPEYDMAVHEVHHTTKVDRPSGTALLLAQVIRESNPGRSKGAKMEVTSTRLGTVIGEHSVRIESPVDRVTIAHEAKSRNGFASGAIRAAEWLMGRKGLFTLEDVFADWLRPESKTAGL